MIIIGCPVRNRAWILNRYLKSIRDLKYNKRDIILCFLENDSTDDTHRRLIDFAIDYSNEYGNFILKKLDYDFEDCERELGRGLDKFHHFARLRNKWVEMFKNLKGISHVFSIDSDVLVPPDSLQKLIANDKDICSLMINNAVHSRGYGRDITNCYSFNDHYGQYENILRYNDDVTEIDVTGSAYLIKRKIFDEVDYQPHALGEDFGFCLKAKAEGYKVFCDGSVKGEHIMKKENNKEER